MAGKEVLIKAVLQAIPSYAMNVIRFPKSFCKGICAEIARFWWSSNGSRRGMHWKSWDLLTKNKNEGGMGFKDFSLMNSAHLAKQAWRVLQNPSALWVQILKALYFPDLTFLQAKRKRKDSLVWASILHGKSVILKFAGWSIGNGEDVSIEHDSWVGDGKLVKMLNTSTNARVCDLLEESRRCWDVTKIRQTFSPNDAIRVLQTQICWTANRDLLYWPATRSGEYSIKS